jgi:hypothetical protein
MIRFRRVYAIIICALLVIGLGAFLFVRNMAGPGGLALIGTMGDQYNCGPYRTPAAGKILLATSGWEEVANNSSHSVTITAVRPITAHNLVIEDLALVPITGGDAVGTSFGLPTDPHNYAGSLIPKDWAMRRLLPAVIPPKSSTPKVKGWQLVYGLGVPKPAPSHLQGALITYKVDGHTYTLKSNIGQGYGPPGKPTCPADEMPA